MMRGLIILLLFTTVIKANFKNVKLDFKLKLELQGLKSDEKLTAKVVHKRETAEKEGYEGVISLT